nr:synaptobrevin, longin-like domain protein [Tanacetum cinerariifolium]
MIAILEKYEHNQDFHQIVDFVEASHIRYALTFNPTVYVSYIRQFWSTARIETTKEGTKILATVDGKLRTVSESSIRRNLKLNDEAGISSLTDAELFEKLTLMGYNISPNQKFTFQKGQFSHQWKYLIHTIMQCLSPKNTGFNEFSSNITTALVCLATNRIYNFSKMIFDDEPASPLGDDSQGKACLTGFGFGADQDWTNIAKTSTLPSDSTQRVTSLATNEDTQELEIITLKAKVKLLEDREGGGIAQSGNDAPIKGGVWMKERKQLKDGGVQVVPTIAEVATASVSIPAGSGVVPTASLTIPTAALIFTTATDSIPYTRRKGKEKMVESDTPKKKKLQEQIDIATDAEILRIHAEEELQIMIDGLDRNNETVAKYLQDYHQFATELPIGRRIEFIILRNQAGWKAKHFKEMPLEEIKEKFDLLGIKCTRHSHCQERVPTGSISSHC